MPRAVFQKGVILHCIWQSLGPEPMWMCDSPTGQCHVECFVMMDTSTITRSSGSCVRIALSEAQILCRFFSFLGTCSKVAVFHVTLLNPKSSPGPSASIFVVEHAKFNHLTFNVERMSLQSQNTVLVTVTLMFGSSLKLHGADFSLTLWNACILSRLLVCQPLLAHCHRSQKVIHVANPNDAL